MKMKCPGQDFRWITVDTYTCDKCGEEEEIFSHETRARCHNCGAWVYKEKLPSCIEWCAAARQCIGEQRWQQLKGNDDGGKQ